MNQEQYRQFLEDPIHFLNGRVKRLRINLSSEEIFGPVDRDSVLLQPSGARVKPVWLRYDDTGIPETSALWVEKYKPALPHIEARAYYLDWKENQANAIELESGTGEQLFFTAPLTGCGILVLETPQNLIIVHHNVQVAAVSKSFLQTILESEQNYYIRDQENRYDVRVQALQALCERIVANNPSIVRGTALDARQYMDGVTGGPASVFGVKGSSGWRIYVNLKIGNYCTRLLYPHM